MKSKIQAIDIALVICFLVFTLFSNFSVSLTQIGAYGGFALFLIRTHLTGTWKEIQFPLAVPITAFLFASMVSVATSVDPMLSFKFLKKLLHLVVFFWVVNALANIHPKEFLVKIAEKLNSEPLRKLLEKWRDPDPVHASISFFTLLFIFSGTASGLWSMIQTLAEGGTLMDQIMGESPLALATRTTGNLADLLSFSELVMFAFLLAITRYLFKKPPNHWLVLVIGVLGLTLLITMSRRTWVASAAVIIFLLYFYRRILITLPLVALIFVVAFGPTSLKHRLFTIVDTTQFSNQERFHMWRAGWDIAMDHPLTGCGLGCQFVIADQYPEHPILKKYTHMHNSPLQVFVEMGLLGFLSWIGIWVAYFQQLFKQWKQRDSDPQYNWVPLSCAAVILGFLTSGIFENNFYDSEIMFAVYFLLAIPFVRKPQTAAT